jgi:hypothetical protein
VKRCQEMKWKGWKSCIVYGSDPLDLLLKVVYFRALLSRFSTLEKKRLELGFAFISGSSDQDKRCDVNCAVE